MGGGGVDCFLGGSCLVFGGGELPAFFWGGGSCLLFLGGGGVACFFGGGELTAFLGGGVAWFFWGGGVDCFLGGSCLVFWGGGVACFWGGSCLFFWGGGVDCFFGGGELTAFWGGVDCFFWGGGVALGAEEELPPVPPSLDETLTSKCGYRLASLPGLPLPHLPLLLPSGNKETSSFLSASYEGRSGGGSAWERG